MVACDEENCEREWFHYACVGLVEPPPGEWFCNDCMVMDGTYRKRLKRIFTDDEDNDDEDNDDNDDMH
ncbi:hypothetical protein DFQ28_005252 [Apophysomyces sp. BC1034]|nr:hypothetical protein DFQ28_005252 [Apophysomyces sp. BC1034]